MPIAIFYLVPFSPMLSFILLLLTPLALIGLHGFISFKTFFTKNHPKQIIEEYSNALPFKHRFNQFESKSTNYSGFPTKHAKESIEWKLKLIENAKYNVALSGSYCGGKIFDRCLDLIEKKMQSLATFKVYLISSEIWMTPSNLQKIRYLQSSYPGQFIVSVTKEKNLSIDLTKGKVQVTCNHIKALVIDYGRYFIVGGSGIEDRYCTYTGEDPIPSPYVPFYKRLTQEHVAPLLFRDCDFIFSSKEKFGVGKQLYIDLIALITKWQTTSDQKRYALEDFQPFEYREEEEYIPEIDHHPLSVSNLKIITNLSGPDDETHHFYENLIRGIEKASKSIVIEHLYFHPSNRLLKALIDASNRGIEITLITNSVGDKTPGLNSLFVSLSKTKYKKIFEGKNKSNVHIYEFTDAHTTLHKKIVVIDDDTVYAGSSNIGFNSMTTKADYELDLIIISKDFAQNTLEKIYLDRDRHCESVSFEQIKKNHMKDKLLAPLQANIEFLL